MNPIVASLTFWYTILYNKIGSFLKLCKRLCLIYVNIPRELGDKPKNEGIASNIGGNEKLWGETLLQMF